MRLGLNTLFLIPGEVGGSETYFTETLRALLFAHPAVTPVFFTNIENDAFMRASFGAASGAEFHLLNVRAVQRAARILYEQLRLPARVRRAGVDVLWSPGYTAPLAVTAPQVVSLLDMQYRRFPEDLSQLARWTTGALVQAAARRADCILTISEFSRTELLRFTPARAGRIVVTPLGVDPVFATPIPADVRAQRLAGLVTGATPYLLCVANSYPHKNLPLLVEAFASAARTIPHQLVLVGRPRRGEPALEQALAASGLAPRIVRLAGMSRAGLAALYQGAEAFVFPSLYEGFGLPVLEAMAAGAPVITTREGALPEVGGEAVTCISGRDPAALSGAICSVVAWSPEFRARHVAVARARALTFTWAATAGRTFAALHSTAYDGAIN
ncbi:MAG: glycosyltransferase family 1 protein [bacterium]